MRCSLPEPAIPRRRSPRRSGQAIIETCIVMALTCLLFFGILEVARLFGAREVLNHAAARGARARTVGFNWWMVEKSIRVASIPNAGRMIEPVFDTADPRLQAEMQAATSSGNLWERLLSITPFAAQYDIERVKIPEYLASHNHVRAAYVLDYSDWDTVRGNHGDSPVLPDGTVVPGGIIHTSVHQDFPMTLPMHRTFYADDNIPLHGDAYLENHYPLYLDDRNW